MYRGRVDIVICNIDTSGLVLSHCLSLLFLCGQAEESDIVLQNMRT